MIRLVAKAKRHWVAHHCALLVALTVGWPSLGLGDQADIVISNAKVISPPHTVIDNGTIVVIKGKITYVGPYRKEANAKRSIDAGGRAVIPGLIDTHVHLNIDPLPSQDLYERWIEQRSGELLRDYLSRGFTTIQSLGDYWPGVLELRERIQARQIAGPRLLIAGPLITPPHGHAAAYSPMCAQRPLCSKSGWYREVSDEKEARALIRELAALHVDAIKIANEPTTSTDGKPLGFAPGVLHALIEEAHLHDLRVYVHPASVDYAIEAIQAGADALAHGPGIEFFLPNRSDTPGNALEPLVKIATDRHIPISTTIVGPLGNYLDAQKTAVLLRDVKLLFDRGITLGFGTDSIGEAIASQKEFEALARSGLTPMQALQVATLNAARELGRDREIGSLEAGKRADLAIVATDPLQSIEFLDRIDLVVKDGEIVFDYYAEANSRTSGR